MTIVLRKFLPFEARIELVTDDRRLSPLESFQLWFSGQEYQDRNLLVLDFNEFSNILKLYFNNFFEAEFDNSLYATFSHVSLTGIDRRQLGISIDENPETMWTEAEGSHSNKDDNEIDTVTLIPVRNGYLRRRRNEVYKISKNYDGVAVFMRDGQSTIPSENSFQSKQLQAHADEDRELIEMLQSAPTSTGLDNIASVYLSVNFNDGINGGDDNVEVPKPDSPAEAVSYDYIIIIAVIVAGCSMILLAFALFLAFRRRSYNGRQPLKTKEMSPRTEQEESPTSNRIPSPPVQVMEVHPEHDDNISDYTESVFSLPVQTKKEKIKESLQKSALINIKHYRASSRFNPRYIMSNKKSSDVDSEESNQDVDRDLAPVGFTSTDKSMQIGTEVSNSRSETTPNPNQGTPEPPGSSGLYPADLINDDISSSLSAYKKGMNKMSHYKNRNPDDAVSLSSAESYGFSLDGVGDQSTIANSTKYGY